MSIYPRNYFDPYGDEPTHAQCTICGENHDIDDFDQHTLDQYNDLDGTPIVEGICTWCAEKLLERLAEEL